jgi:hypothetical protein
VEPTLSCGGFLYEEGEGLDPDEVGAYLASVTHLTTIDCTRRGRGWTLTRWRLPCLCYSSYNSKLYEEGQGLDPVEVGA